MLLNVPELLRDPSSKYFLIPIITLLLGVLAKIISQNDKVKINRPMELFYLAPNLLVANFILIICEFSRYSYIDSSQQQLFSEACFSALMFNIGTTIAITLFIRKMGWDTKMGRLKVWQGILIPDFFAVVVMYFVFKMISI